MADRAFVEADRGRVSGVLSAVRPLLLLLALIFAAPAGAMDDDLRSIAAMKGHLRVLVALAPSMRDPKLEQQRQAMARFAAGAAERDLAFVQVAEGKVIGAHDTAAAISRRFPGHEGKFYAVLIGKDGQVALESAEPLDEVRLARTIDAMPTRQDEVRRARAGLGRPEP